MTDSDARLVDRIRPHLFEARFKALGACHALVESKDTECFWSTLLANLRAVDGAGELHRLLEIDRKLMGYDIRKRRYVSRPTWLRPGGITALLDFVVYLATEVQTGRLATLQSQLDAAGLLLWSNRNPRLRVSDYYRIVGQPIQPIVDSVIARYVELADGHDPVDQQVNDMVSRMIENEFRVRVALESYVAGRHAALLRDDTQAIMNINRRRLEEGHPLLVGHLATANGATSALRPRGDRIAVRFDLPPQCPLRELSLLVSADGVVPPRVNAHAS
jgi:hypothetical protein